VRIEYLNAAAPGAWKGDWPAVSPTTQGPPTEPQVPKHGT
jgi:hypothetical protein